MPLYRALALISVKVKDTFRKVLARGARTHEHYLCAKDRLIHLRISLSQSRDSCSQRRVSCIRTKFSREFSPYQLFPSKSGTTFQKVVRLFRKSYHFFPYQLFPTLYQLFPSLYQLFPSQGTPIPRTRTASSFSSEYQRDTSIINQRSLFHVALLLIVRNLIFQSKTFD